MYTAVEIDKGCLRTQISNNLKALVHYPTKPYQQGEHWATSKLQNPCIICIPKMGYIHL